MSNDLSKVIACIVDHGLFFGLAQELARENGFGRVLYHDPEWERGFPSIRDGIVGDGFPEIECCLDLWSSLDDIDLFIFPDIQHASLQRHLVSLGKMVWGPRSGDDLEIDRELFLKTLKDVGLDVPQYEVVEGLTNLRSYLHENPERIVKISRWRADVETFRYHDDARSRPDLDALATRLGPLQDDMPFLVFKPIETPIEVGYDGYFVNGFPTRSMHGPEIKDKVYLGAMRDYADLPEPVRRVNNAFKSVLAAYDYRAFWSTEIRVKGKHAYFIDPTARAGLPSGDAQFKAYKNLAQIIYSGSQGELVDPEPAYTFMAQALIEHSDPPSDWRVLDIPDAAYQWVKLMRPCKVDGIYAIAPGGNAGETVGSVLGGGNTIEEAIAHCQENAKLISHNSVEIHTASFADALRELQEMESRGLDFSDDDIPEPAIAIEPA